MCVCLFCVFSFVRIVQLACVKLNCNVNFIAFHYFVRGFGVGLPRGRMCCAFVSLLYLALFVCFVVLYVLYIYFAA